MEKEKKVLVQIDSVRICEYDSLNVKIERLEETKNPITKEVKPKWTFKGYSRTILTALEVIQQNELLIDKKAVSDLKTYLKQIRESNEQLKQAIAQL